jgi:hypothetical protein
MKKGIVVGYMDDKESLALVLEEFEELNPGFKLGSGAFEGDGVLSSAYGGVRHVWIEEGQGSIYLPKDYRTKEGDGGVLPPAYRTDRLDAKMLEAMRFLSENIDGFHDKIKMVVAAIVARLGEDGTYAGDIAGEVWRVVESSLAKEKWAERKDLREALQYAIDRYQEIGWSTKTESSYEPLWVGDQITTVGEDRVKIEGSFKYWWIENVSGRSTHISTARRTRYLKDTAGGCNFAFDAFRRLPLTWYANTGTPENPDGINTVNSHLVNIAAETSQTHYHPVVAIGGGKPQGEMYQVLDPSAYNLNTYGRKSYLYTFPDLDNLYRYAETPLHPGTIVYIRPGTGHRGVDVFVNVVTLPGFKPGNEIYLDQKIKDVTGGKSPYNSNVVKTEVASTY